jgi:hypothetical protein
VVDRAFARCAAFPPRRALRAACAALSLLLLLAPPCVARGGFARAALARGELASRDLARRDIASRDIASGDFTPRPLGPSLAGVELCLERGAFRAGPAGLGAPRQVWLAASGSALPELRGARWIQPLAAGAEVGSAQREGLWSYDLALPAGVDLGLTRFAIEGAQALVIAPNGALEVRCALGRLEHSAPRAWIVDADGRELATPVRFALRGAFEVAFEVPKRPLGHALRIDPGLRWSAAWGGSGDEVIHALARAADGDWIVCGETRSLDLFGTAGALQPLPGGGGDAFVARLASDGAALRWATYLGGRADDVARALCVAPDGSLYVAGGTSSGDFPTTSGALSRTLGGARDAFLARLSGDGRALLASTFAGGSGDDEARACAWVIDHPVIAGGTNSSDLPTHAAAFQRAPRGGLDGFALELSADLSALLAGTYWGGGARDEVQALLFDGELVLGGSSESPDLPTTPLAWQRSPRGADLFVARFAPGLVAPRCSTYFGGSGAESEIALACDGAGRVALATSSSSDDLPTSAASFSPVRASQGAPDAFVALLDADLTQVLAGTYLGGTSVDGASAIAIGPSGEMLVAGLTLSSNFPRTAGAFQTAHASLVPFSRHDAWVARLDAELRSLTYASFLGGSAAELAPRITWDPEGDALIALATSSPDFPSAGATLPPRGAGLDLAVARIDLLPAGMRRYGRASAGARSTPLLWANEPPRAASTSFRLGLRGGGAHAAALHLFSPRAASAPWSALGLELWLDPAPPAFVLAFACDASGSFELPLAAPPGLAGQRVHVQSLSFDLAYQSLASSAAYELELR